MGNPNSLGVSPPLDNVQRFERIRDSGMFLQTMADLGEDKDAINALTEEIKLGELRGLPVKLIGGLVQTVGLDDSGGTANVFVPNKITDGVYQGVTWRRTPSKMMGEDGEEWYLCHVVHTGTDDYFDEQGNNLSKNNLTYVTAANADVEIVSQAGSHDFRKLAADGFTLKVDQVATDEALHPMDQLEIIAKMVGKINAETTTKEQKAMLLQRISYMNYIGLFSGAICVSPYVYVRDKEDNSSLTVLTNSSGNPMSGVVEMVGLDHLMDKDEGYMRIDESNEVLSLEVQIEGWGLASVPYVHGKTFIYTMGQQTREYGV